MKRILLAAALAAAPLPLAGLGVSPPQAPGNKVAIKHVVVLYMENHSFDNVLGFWCDNHPGRCPTGGMPSRVTLSDGSVVTPGVDPDVVPIVMHNVLAQNLAIDGGKMDGWESFPDGSCDAATGYQCVSGYKPSRIPNISRLANRFAISDHAFSMADSPSWGGHLYVAMPSTDGFLGNIPGPAKGVRPGPGWGCNSNKVTAWKSRSGRIQQVPSCVPDPALGIANGGAFEPTPVPFQPTIFDRLAAAGLSWHLYTGTPSNGWAVCPSFADCWDTTQRHQEAALTSFAAAAAAGHLPSFSVVTPGYPYTQLSEHNGFSMAAGDNWLGQIAHDVMTSPDWSSTALFITWDDCGCFYDQVPPGINPDGTQQGPRVPLVIVSPYAKPGFTDTTATTFAGILAYVEHTFGLKPIGVNDAHAYPFTNAFNYSQQPLRPVPMVHRPVPAGDRIDRSQARQDT